MLMWRKLQGGMCTKEGPHLTHAVSACVFPPLENYLQGSLPRILPSKGYPTCPLHVGNWTQVSSFPSQLGKCLCGPKCTNVAHTESSIDCCAGEALNAFANNMHDGCNHHALQFPMTHLHVLRLMHRPPVIFDIRYATQRTPSSDLEFAFASYCLGIRLLRALCNIL